jgi:hypothetical protein
MAAAVAGTHDAARPRGKTCATQGAMRAAVPVLPLASAIHPEQIKTRKI